MNLLCAFGLHKKQTEWEGSWDDYTDRRRSAWGIESQSGAGPPPPLKPIQPTDEWGNPYEVVRLWSCVRCDAFGKEHKRAPKARRRLYQRARFYNEVASLKEDKDA